MHRSSNRDAYEAKMEFNPERKAELLSKSQYRRHRLMVAGTLEEATDAQQAATQTMNTEGEVV